MFALLYVVLVRLCLLISLAVESCVPRNAFPKPLELTRIINHRIQNMDASSTFRFLVGHVEKQENEHVRNEPTALEDIYVSFLIFSLTLCISKSGF